MVKISTARDSAGPSARAAKDNGQIKRMVKSSESANTDSTNIMMMMMMGVAMMMITIFIITPFSLLQSQAARLLI